ncbi:hypothetical protein ACOMA7_00670 [Apilactobacillus sp. 1-1-2]|uniref:hypothetical protein n=1 Tax=Apilactobacillus sp. 1-1-2 TaxID=3411035 RepID=UPI003B9274B8
MMNYETPFDLAAFLNEDFEINRYDEEIPNYRFSAEKKEIPDYRITKEEGDVHCLIELNLGDKPVASFYEDGTWSIYSGIYSCAIGELNEIFGFIYETDIKCWFKD